MFVWHHHSLPITQYFSHYLWAPYLSLDAAFSFSFFSSIPKLTEPSEKKKKSKVGQKLRLWVPYVCLITILPLSYELWKLKTAKSCFQFP